jgi:hypothetical protein
MRDDVIQQEYLDQMREWIEDNLGRDPWEWPDTKVIRAVAKLYHTGVNGFLREHS